jgi:CRISPR/Cas system CSM-associated protein Csm3 (group 7 of RAMP superfamily)
MVGKVLTLTFILIEATGRLETPLHIGDGRSIGVTRYTRTYIPGSVIRGCVGLLLKRTSCELREGQRHKEGEDCLYHQLIEDEDGGQANAFFRYVYALHIGCGGTFYPTPMSVSVCRNPQCNYLTDTFSPPIECPQCGRSLRPAPRYRCSKCHKLIETPVRTYRTTMTSIDRTHNTAAFVTDSEGERRGTLHSMELIEPGSQFRIQALLSPEAEKHASLLGKIIEEALGDEGIGASKSRGLGKVAVRDLKITKISPDQVKLRAGELGNDEVTLSLLSPSVVQEEEPLRIETVLESARRAHSQVFRSGKPFLREPRLAEQRSRFILQGGWSLRQNRKRRTCPALIQGSTILLTDVDEQVKLALASLEQTYAIGGFKTHGCGQVLLR